MKVNNYFFAGLDFIFDKNDNIWFLEANYAPHGAKNIKKTSGKEEITKEIARLMNKDKGEKCVLVSRSLTGKEEGENSAWFALELAKYVKNLRLCYCDENQNRKGKMKDINGNFFSPSIIFRYNRPLTSAFEKKALVINSNKVRNLVNNKMLTLKVVRENTKVNVPKTFYVKDTKELKELISVNRDVFKEGYVVKPIDQSQGRGVYVLKKGERVPQIKEKEIVEERIVPKLLHQHYWDVRVFVINGKYIGGEMRKSRTRVTNVSRGGKPSKLPKKLHDRLKKPALEIVKAIDRYCE
ncbi:MAG: hypothetical protein ABIJ18_02195 [archaeon]